MTAKLRFLALGAACLIASLGYARDNGQWETNDTTVRAWYRELMQPDNPMVSCCGEADAYYADSFEVHDGKYLAIITDTRDGRHYVGKVDGADSIRQRWSTYAANGHGGNVELRNLNPATFRLSLLRVFDPATPTPKIDVAENHFKHALDSRRHGLNRN